MIRIRDAWDAALLFAIIVAIPAGIFHFMGGRYAQVIIAVVLVAIGLRLLWPVESTEQRAWFDLS